MAGPKNSNTILVVEDDEFVQQLLCAVLESAGFSTLRAGSIQALNEQITLSNIDGILLDLGLPDGDGIDVLKQIRADKNMVPIIILTRRAEVETRIAGLEAGADDYVTKPVEPKELLLRIRRLISEPDQHPMDTSATTRIQLGPWILDLSRRTLVHDEQGEFSLTRSEFDLLTAFFKAPDRVLNREQLLNAIERTDTTGYDRTVDVLVSRIRKKLAIQSKRFAAIETVQGIGYKLQQTALEAKSN